MTVSQLGLGLVLMALLTCAAGAPIGFVTGATRSAAGLQWTKRLAYAFALFMLLANLVMEYALVTRDFSVSYVASVGSRATPLYITIVSLWSSLEGSILFWGLVVGIFTAAVTFLQRSGHDDYLGYTLGTMLAVGLFFSLLIAGPANPFRPTPPPIPTDGPGPNPLLQNHLLMIIHPPMLYFGYVGMTAPFAMAVAALLRGQLGASWLRPLRNWLLVPTGFLTLGIMLGGWWSYEVLGWGGYWAWDPVENASFLPWLTAIAALHSAVVMQRRGSLKAWTVVLIMVSFLLTILGTFLTRSGVVNSVHSFTQSPIGPMFLSFLAIALLAVILLLSFRIDRLVSEPTEDAVFAREGAFLLNNLLLVTFTFTVLIGTLYPIIAEAVRGVKVSVGEPYFNRMAVPICLGLLLLMGVGPALPWGRSDRRSLSKALLVPLPAGLVALILAAVLGARNPSVLITAMLAGYALWVTLEQAFRPARVRASKGESIPQAIDRSFRRAPRRIGAYLVHFGVIVTFVAIAISSTYQTTMETTLSPGQSASIADYQLTFDRVRIVEEPHLTEQRATIEIAKSGKPKGILEPSLNHYPTRSEPIGTPAVRSTLTHDLYLTVMNVDGQGRLGLKAIVTPAVYWIWIGVILMVAGTGLCLVPPKKVKVPAPVMEAATS